MVIFGVGVAPLQSDGSPGYARVLHFEGDKTIEALQSSSSLTCDRNVRPRLSDDAIIGVVQSSQSPSSPRALRVGEEELTESSSDGNVRGVLDSDDVIIGALESSQSTNSVRALCVDEEDLTSDTNARLKRAKDSIIGALDEQLESSSSPNFLRTLCSDQVEMTEAHLLPMKQPNTSECEAENNRRLVAFWRAQFAYSSSFCPLVIQFLHERGVDSLPQARFLIDDAKNGIVFYPSTLPMFVQSAGGNGNVFVNMTTASLAQATSFFEFDESALSAEFAAIKRSQHLAVLMVLVELCVMQRRSNAPIDHPEHLPLRDDEIALLEPSIRFVAALLKAEPHGNTRRRLSFTLGSHLTATSVLSTTSVLGLRVAFEPKRELAHIAGYTEFVRLVAHGVKNCHMCGWESRAPFYDMDDILRMVSTQTYVAPKRMRSAD
jgi:hypothetical protein